MPRAAAPSRANLPRSNVNVPPRVNNTQARVNNGQPRANGVRPPVASTTHRSPNSYLYGSGASARSYRAYGYGRGYRNRSYAGRSGYGRSQGNNQAIVARLRSVHRSLGRLDHDYQGHRVQAMHQISMAVRQLSHRSMVYNGSGFGAGGGMSRRVVGNNRAGAGNRRAPRLPQAQSDARMAQALRTTQGIFMQMSHQGQGTSGHARARGHVQRAMHELNTALTVR
jgi:hypothetical protein